MSTDTFEYGNVSLHDNQVTPSNVVIINVDPKPIPDDAQASLVTKRAAVRLQTWYNRLLQVLLGTQATVHGHLIAMTVDKGSG